MIEVTGNLWTYPADFRVITTNGAVRKDGHAVMGRGCAKEAALLYPALPVVLGDLLTRRGNHVHFIARERIDALQGLFTFPVKDSWEQPAKYSLIEQSAQEFYRHILTSCTYVIPRPGCGNGSLRWENVRPILEFLPNNVHVIAFPEKLRA